MNQLDLPEGPSSLRELFQWPAFNATRLLRDSANSEQYRKNFAKIARIPVHMHEAYSGMGTASMTLHMQHRQLVSA